MATQGHWPPAGGGQDDNRLTRDSRGAAAVPARLGPAAEDSIAGNWSPEEPFDRNWPAAGPAGRKRRHRIRRRLRLAGLSVLAWFLAVVAVAVWVPHGGLLAAILALAGLPALVAVTLVVVLALVARWAWRSSAWLEVVPLAAGAPWLSRLLWAARALLAGRAAWRAGRRLHRRVSRAPAA
ncbi:MAG: hypothetical protein LBI49_25980 [Nocardiopsaceae bacterium]|jgi:hypothetical protein|nr:hypothetical protein [Nocardiopsaceae bacterium]